MQLFDKFLTHCAWIMAPARRNGREGGEGVVMSSLGCCRKRWGRRKIRLIEGNAKCHQLKNWPAKGLCLRPRTPSPLLTNCVRAMQYTYSHKKGGDSWTIEKVRWETIYSYKLGRKYQHDWLFLQSINSYKHLPRSPFTSQFFKWPRFVLVSLLSYLVHGVGAWGWIMPPPLTNTGFPADSWTHI